MYTVCSIANGDVTSHFVSSSLLFTFDDVNLLQVYMASQLFTHWLKREIGLFSEMVLFANCFGLLLQVYKIKVKKVIAIHLENIWSQSSFLYCIILKTRDATKSDVKFYRRFLKWATSSEFGTYRLCEQRRFRRACASAQSRQNLRCSLIQAESQEEPSDRNPDPWSL